jgi:hypothetical protein
VGLQLGRRLFIAGVAIAVAVAVAAPAFVFGVYLPSFVTRDGAVDRSRCARAALAPPAAQGRLVVFIVDGLGYRYARALPALRWLVEEAAMRPLTVSFPSYTTPALLSFTTGLGPRDSGVRLNAPTRSAAAGLDHLGAAARDAGRPIVWFDAGWQPFGEIMQVEPEALWRGRRAAEASAFVTPAAPLRVVYFGDVDAEGHKHGEASPPFARAAAEAARLIARQRAALDPARDRLLVVSDHGHRPDGGHGGVEPAILEATFALWGAEVRRGAELDARPAADVAATIAALAGIATPACNLGRPMLDALDVDDAARARRYAEPYAQGAGLACSLEPGPGCDGVAETSARLAAGEGAALAGAEAWFEGWRRARDARLDADEGWARWLRSGVAALGLVALGLVARRRGVLPPPAAWIIPLVLLAVFAAFLGVRGYRVTFSRMPEQADFVRDALLGGVLSVAAAVAISVRLRAPLAGIAALAGVVGPFVCLVAYAGIGTHTVRPPFAGLVVILSSPALIGASLAGVILLLRERINDARRRGAGGPPG